MFFVKQMTAYGLRMSYWSSDVCASDREHGLHVLDFWSRRGADGPARTAVAILLRSARADGHASVSVELSAAAATGAWPALGFIAREAPPAFARWCGRQEEALATRLWLTYAAEAHYPPRTSARARPESQPARAALPDRGVPDGETPVG